MSNQNVDPPLRPTNMDLGAPHSDRPVDLREYAEFGAENGELKGKVVVLVQGPPWMSGHYPDVSEAAAAGAPPMDEYTAEWFERIVFASEESLAPARQQQVEGLHLANTLLQSPFSNGCAKSAPIVQILDMAIDPKAQASTRYHALITKFYDEESDCRQPKEIGIYPVGQDVITSLRGFVATPRHKFLKSKDPRPTLKQRHRRAMKRDAEQP